MFAQKSDNQFTFLKSPHKIHKLVKILLIWSSNFVCYVKAIIIYAVGGTLLLVFIGLTIYCCRRKSTSTNTSQASIVARRSTKNSSSDRVVLETGHNAISDADVWNPKVLLRPYYKHCVFSPKLHISFLGNYKVYYIDSI